MKDYHTMTKDELFAAYREAVKNNADYNWIKGCSSMGYMTTIAHIEEELKRRIKEEH